jgi:hypothetical protein
LLHAITAKRKIAFLRHCAGVLGQTNDEVGDECCLCFFVVAQEKKVDNA